MKAQRAILIVAFYLFLTLYYLRSLLFVEKTLSDLAVNLCIAITVTLACIADSNVISRPMPHAAKWVMLFTWPVAVPIYMLWSRRGWRGLLLLIVHGLIICTLWIGMAMLMVGMLKIEPR